MARGRSLGTRLLVATLATAAITFGGVVGLVTVRTGQNVREQADEVTGWSEAQVSEALLGDAKLADARLAALREDVGRRFAGLAKRWDVVKAIFSGNTVAISELLRPALAIADLDGAIAFDLTLRAISADRVDAPILEANAVIGASAIADALRALLGDNRPDAPSGFMHSLPLDPPLRKALAIAGPGEVVDVFAQPFFDEFGEVAGVIVGHRVLGPREPNLVAFAELSGRGVFLIRDGTVISSTGTPIGPLTLSQRRDSHLRFLPGGREAARCLPTEPGLRICATAQVRELEELSQKLVGIGEEHSRSTLATLFFAALAALAAFTAVVTATSRQITRPLARITDVVVEVARGNWRAPVPGTARGDEVGDIARAVLVLESSLEDRDRLRQDIVLQNERFDAALTNMSQGLCMFDAGGRLTVFNPRLLAIHRLAPDDVRAGLSADALRAPLSAPETWPAPQGAEDGERLRALPDGRIVEISIERMADGGWVETHEDVTESRRAQARIARMALYDGLTELPNRTLFGDRLEAALGRGRRRGRSFAVLCLDLDDFKGVNDTLGHGVGDELLRGVAGRLTAAAPADATVARLGGDEFAILIEEGSAATRVAEALIGSLAEPFRLSGHLVTAAASVGIAACSDEDENGDRLMRRADLALYTAKAAGRGRLCVFEPALEERLHYRKWLEQELRKALANEQIRVFYQPLVDIRSNRVSGFEALARWTHPERGPISPGDFIPLAEAVGLIDELGRYVLRRACADAARWPDDVKVAVNVSAVEIRHPDFCDSVKAALAASGLPNRRLELEITESVVLGDDPAVLAKLHRLRALGIRFSMDDFGTGYSSLSSLRSFPFDKIKLDQSFVRDVLSRGDCATIVRVTADLGRSLGLTTLAEGVETRDQLAHLAANGFCEAQGYLFSPAVPFERACELLAPAREERAA